MYEVLVKIVRTQTDTDIKTQEILFETKNGENCSKSELSSALLWGNRIEKVISQPAIKS